MEEKEYEQDLAIDPHSLDEDWLRQPGLYMKYSVLAADAQKRRDQAKDKIDVIKAELDRTIRSATDDEKAKKYKLEKVTESAIASCILVQSECKIASDELIQANYELNMLQSAVRALDHKRSALENEVKLWLGSYFSGPKEPRDIPGGKRIIDLARDKVSSKMREVINSKEIISDTSMKAGKEVGVEQSRRRRG